MINLNLFNLADSVSQPPSCPTSPVGEVQSPDPDSDPYLPRHRLQRQKAPSRKTFRYRKSHRGAGWAAHTEAEEESGGESIAMIPTKSQLPMTEEDNPAAVPEVAFIQKQSVSFQRLSTNISFILPFIFCSVKIKVF